MGFAHFEPHGLVRIFFPNKDTSSFGIHIEETKQELWYDLVLRPALLTMYPTRDSELPATYRRHKLNSRVDSGQIRPYHHIVSSNALSILEDNMRDLVVEAGEELAWARGFFFGHQIRGVKGDTVHLLADNPDERNEGMEEALQHAMSIAFREDIEDGDLENFYVDVGLEFYAPECAVQWHSDSHGPVLRREIPGLTPSQAARTCRPGAPDYFQDIQAQITFIAGGRIVPRVDEDNVHHLAYMQLYSTEKAISHTPNLNRNVIYLNAASATRAAPGAAKKLEDMSDRARTAGEHKVATCARVEVRVPYSHTLQVLQPFSRREIREHLLTFRASVWW
jgi:hypothetical protein